MKGKSFSNRLSWRIIGIVSVICILAQVAVYSAYRSWQDSPWLHVVMPCIGVASLAAIFFACRTVINSITDPIRKLSEAALKMAKGDFNALLPEIKSEDEMRRLHDSFQTMQNSLTDYIEELKTTTAINERIRSDIDLARKIQNGMLRKEFPPFLYALLNPARKVGGDLYDYTVNDNKLYFAIGDVSGKGVAASLMMAITRVMLRFVVSEGDPLDETLRRINDTFSEANEMGMFVTLFVARVDLTTGHMDYCNAGHNPVLVIPPDGEPYFLRCKANIAVGLMKEFKYEAEQIDLPQGTRIVAYTDGVTEAERADLDQYGEERLLDWAGTIKGEELEEKEVVENLSDSVKAFVEGNPQNDDITIVSLTIPVGTDLRVSPSPVGPSDVEQTVEHSDTSAAKMIKKRFNPITDKSSEIVAYLMASPNMPSDPDLRFKIELSVEEAVENVVRYAYEGGIGWLEAGTSFDNESLVLTIELRDAGVPFNPLEKDDPDITLSANERPVGGLGIYLCKQMMDSISYRYEDGNNVLIMKKKV